MTRDKITRMAREAGFVGLDGSHGALRRFAALVAAAEREACAKIVDVYDYTRFSEECAAAIRARGEKGQS